MLKVVTLGIIFSLYLAALENSFATQNIHFGVTVMKKDADVPDIQNFVGYVLDLKICQTPVFQNTFIISMPITFAYFIDEKDPASTLFVSALTPEGEAFFFPLTQERWLHPFATSSFGPAWFSKPKLGQHFKIGGNVGFQSTVGIGVYLGRKFCVECYILHYCNAGISKPNKGATMPIVGGGWCF